jgi:N-acetylneuraminate synthase/sialic acid synthase
MNREMIIERRLINDDRDCYVIAEIGNNHQGSVQMAKELFRAAKECGADAVKLQKRHNASLFTKEIYDKPYDHENSFGKTYGEHREALEFGLEEYQELIRTAQELDITLFATAFDFKSADFLADLDMPAFKIASGDLTNIPLIRHVARFQKPLVVSTGGGTMDDVQRLYNEIMPINSQLCIMQCTAGYPAAFEELNLRVIETFLDRFPGVIVGLSSHDSGIAMALVAYVMGARIIEKHFTLNRAMKGTDHAFSLERPGLRRLVRDLKRARVAMGDGIKRLYPSEKDPLFKMGKKLVAACDLPSGRVLSRDDIAIKSPNNGIPPFQMEEVLGKQTCRPVHKDENIDLRDLAPPIRN